MDILYLVDRLENLIASSRRMPLVNQMIVKESDMLNIVDQMRTSVPDEIKQARRVLQEKERILAQAQAEASSIIMHAREEAERMLHREGLLRLAEERSGEILHQAQEQGQRQLQQSEAQAEQMRAEADAYATETLRNLRDHLLNVETEVGRTILSIEKGLESLEEPQAESPERSPYEIPPSNEQNPPRRASSLAADTMGGPNF